MDAASGHETGLALKGRKLSHPREFRPKPGCGLTAARGAPVIFRGILTEPGSGGREGPDTGSLAPGLSVPVAGGRFSTGAQRQAPEAAPLFP
jgi:hypothetical protein